MKKLFFLLTIAILIAPSSFAQTYVLDSVYAISHNYAVMDAQAFIAVSASDSGYAQPTLNGQPSGNPILLTGSVTGLYSLPGIPLDNLSGNTAYEASLDVYYFEVDTVTGDTTTVLDQSTAFLPFTTLLDPQLGEIPGHDSLPSTLSSVSARIYFVCGNDSTAVIIRSGDQPGVLTNVDTVMVIGQGHFDYTVNGVQSGATKYFKIETFNALGFSLEPYNFQLTALSPVDPSVIILSVDPLMFEPDSAQLGYNVNTGTSSSVQATAKVWDENWGLLQTLPTLTITQSGLQVQIITGLVYPGDLPHFVTVDVIDLSLQTGGSDTVSFISEVYPELPVEEPELKVIYFEETPGNNVRVGVRVDPKGNALDLSVGIVNDGNEIDDFEDNNRPPSFQVDTVWVDFGSYVTCLAVQAQARVDVLPAGSGNSIAADSSLEHTIIINEMTCTNSVEEEFWRNFQITQNHVILPSNLSQGTIVLTDMSGRIVEEQQTIAGRVAFSKFVTKGTYIVTFVAEENEYVFSQSFGLGYY
jgi:hypothetical protein